MINPRCRRYSAAGRQGPSPGRQTAPVSGVIAPGPSASHRGSDRGRPRPPNAVSAGKAAAEMRPAPMTIPAPALSARPHWWWASSAAPPPDRSSTGRRGWWSGRTQPPARRWYRRSARARARPGTHRPGGTGTPVTRPWTQKLVAGHPSPSGRVYLHAALPDRPTDPKDDTTVGGGSGVRPGRQDHPHHQGPGQLHWGSIGDDRSLMQYGCGVAPACALGRSQAGVLGAPSVSRTAGDRLAMLPATAPPSDGPSPR